MVAFDHPVAFPLPGGAASLLALGFILGLRHALDADHLIAVSTIVSERKGFLTSSIVGMLWGIGHTFSLLVVGLIVIALQVHIHERIAQLMEFAVAGMLILLGSRVLWQMRRGGRLHAHVHEHGWVVHAHPHIHTVGHEADHKHMQPFTLRLAHHLNAGKRSILVGIVHGMAGSAALMLVVLATIPSAKLALLYVGVFGVGSIGGMLMMSTLIGIPFVLTAQRSDKLNAAVRGISGVVSVVFGLYLAWQIGVVEGLFL